MCIFNMLTCIVCFWPVAERHFIILRFGGCYVLVALGFCGFCSVVDAVSFGQLMRSWARLDWSRLRGNSGGFAYSSESGAKKNRCHYLVFLHEEDDGSWQVFIHRDAQAFFLLGGLAVQAWCSLSPGFVQQSAQAERSTVARMTKRIPARPP